ncbi:FAD-binding protein [Thermodesulfobacteriota bacterium]
MESDMIETDVLCIGGGPTGLMAAIRASELGARVVVADKCNTLHSGSGTAGNDHFLCYNPEFHGTDRAAMREAIMNAPLALKNPAYVDIWMDQSFEMVKLWDSWGIPMRYKGEWNFGGHSYPGEPRIYMHYEGGNQKQVLTEEALKRGVKIINRVTVFELLKDKEQVVGAIGYDTWNDRLLKFAAKSILMGTGRICRLYPSVTPGYMMNTPFYPYCTGDGRAMGLRAGANLASVEFTVSWAGPKYFARSGKGSWIGVFRDPSGKPIGPFVTKPNTDTGDIISDIYPALFNDFKVAGKGPVYMDCRGATREDIEYMYHWLENEGNLGLLSHIKKQGIDPLKHMIEFGTYEFGMKGGLASSPASESNLDGLYVSGDEYGVMSGMAPAVIWGWIAGESMAKRAKDVELAGIESLEPLIEEETNKLNKILNRTSGASWQEVNIALQTTMVDYAGGLRSEALLEQGLINLSQIREMANEIIMARNGHELGRCLEVLNLIDVGESLMSAARERKETRGPHKRSDYPFTNPLMSKMLLTRKTDGKFIFEWGGKI